MPDIAINLTTACWGVALIAALVIALPQSLLLIRTSVRRDDLWWFRLKSSLLFGSLALAMARNLAVWADFALFNQRYFGTIERRWPMDLGLSALIMAAVVLAAILYVRTQTEVRP
jgi:hypothetical protein